MAWASNGPVSICRSAVPGYSRSTSAIIVTLSIALCMQAGTSLTQEVPLSAETIDATSQTRKGEYVDRKAFMSCMQGCKGGKRDDLLKCSKSCQENSSANGVDREFSSEHAETDDVDQAGAEFAWSQEEQHLCVGLHCGTAGTPVRIALGLPPSGRHRAKQAGWWTLPQQISRNNGHDSESEESKEWMKPRVVIDGTAMQDFAILADNSVTEIVASWVLHCVDGEHAALLVLREWYRSLEAGGRLTIAVPDFSSASWLYLRPATPSHARKRLLEALFRPPQAGASRPQMAFDIDLLANLVTEAGFASVQRLGGLPPSVAGEQISGWADRSPPGDGGIPSLYLAAVK